MRAGSARVICVQNSGIIKATHSSRYQVETYSCLDDWTNCDGLGGDDFVFENPTDPKNPPKLYDKEGLYLQYNRDATWWRPNGMNVWIDDDNPVSDVHFIEIGENIENTKEWPKYFVLYQDGNVRLIPFPPVKIEDVCFGSSILVGPADISTRPFAAIESVHYLSSTKVLEITYRNGDRFNIILKDITREKAELRVEIVELNNPSIPFVTLRSMYVNDGNADVGKATLFNSDEVNEFSILSFTEGIGSKWQFYRSILSQHNQSAPDFEIKFHSSALPPVYRFWSPSFGHHFFTASENEKDHLISGDPNWNYEGIAWYIPSIGQQNTNPVYRFWSDGFQGHFFTSDENEKNHLVCCDPNWTYEGIAFYSYPSEQSNSIPVYRFWSDGFQGHFFTSDENEKNHLVCCDPNWTYEGIAYYALP